MAISKVKFSTLDNLEVDDLEELLRNGRLTGTLRIG